MKHLEYNIDIAADPKTVWNTMLQPETYKEWVKDSWPGSYYDGKWAKGENIRFLSSQGGGTLANIVEFAPYENMLAKHIAVINADGTEDRSSETAKGWVGTLERYVFTKKDGKTSLSVQIDTTPEWESMFNEGWPGALKKLKEISERQPIAA